MLAVSLVAAGWHWHKPVWFHARVMYWQHQCLTYSAPADQVVYEEEPAKAAALIRQTDYLALPSAAVYPTAPNPASMPPVAGFQPRAYRMWYQTALGGPPLPDAVVFMHELRTAAGVLRLVVVELSPQSFQPLYQPFELRATLYEPASASGLPVRLPPPRNEMMPIDMPAHVLEPASIRFFAGQCDPSDPAHFTIAYEMIDPSLNAPGRGTIDGRLSDDGAVVKLVVRDGPAQPPSPWGTPAIPDR